MPWAPVSGRPPDVRGERAPAARELVEADGLTYFGLLTMLEPIFYSDKNGPALPSIGERTFGLAMKCRMAALLALAAIALASTVRCPHCRLGSMIALPLAVYLVVTALAFTFRRRSVVIRLGSFFPYVDIGLAFFLHQQGLRSLPQLAAAWSVSSVCVFILIVALAGVSSTTRAMVLVTALAAAAEVILLHATALSVLPIVAAVVAVVLVAVATNAAPRTAAVALKQSEEAAVAQTALATLREQHQRLEVLQREKEALLETIVHDMRSPVGAALLSVEYLAIELKKDAKQAALLEATDDALGTLNSLSRMISQILDMSKLEGGRLTLRFEVRALRSTLEEAVAAALPRAKARSMSIELQAPDGLAAALEMRLFPRAVDALLTYSIRHASEQSRILVVASRGESEIRVSIHSNAPALPIAERGRLFDKFPVVGDQPRLPTWGVGLYFCRLVAEAHQGHLAVEEVDGWPTSIVWRLPSTT